MTMAQALEHEYLCPDRPRDKEEKERRREKKRRKEERRREEKARWPQAYS